MHKNKKIKVLMAPVNMAGQAEMLLSGLRKAGVDARQLQYGAHKFGYNHDMSVSLNGRPRYEVQIETLKNMIEMDFDVYHFWFRSLIFGSHYKGFPGLDLPFIKCRGSKIMHRFTGYDARLVSLEKELNPYNAFNYGMEPIFDETEQLKYLDYLKCYVDQFVVQDIEMKSYFPDAEIIPRSINLEAWKYVGISNNSCPLIIHGPSKPEIKGTKFILRAVEELSDEGLKFDFKLVHGMSHDEAKGWIKKCDIAVDQLHVGWYGVFTMECMAMGKPVLVYVREDVFNQAKPAIPIANCNPDNIKTVLRKTIKDYEYRSELSKAGRAYVEEVHDVNKVASSLGELYKRVLQKPVIEPKNTSDIDFMLHSFKHLQSLPTQNREIAKAIIQTSLNLKKRAGNRAKKWVKIRWSDAKERASK